MVRLSDRPDMTLNVYCGRKTAMQQQQQPVLRDHLSKAATFSESLEPKYSVNEPVLRGHLS